MNELEAFFQAKHKELEGNYRHSDGISAAHCGLIALDMAKKVEAQGKRPSLFDIIPVSSEGSTRPRSIVPKAYEGRIRWGGHTVCVADGLVWDPMLEHPEPFKTYADTAFEGPVEMVLDDRALEKQ